LKETIKKFSSGENGDNRHIGMSEELKKRFEVKAVHYVNSFIGKTWKELWDSLLNSKNTWDTYSLAQLFYYELFKLKLTTDNLSKYFIGEYLTLLINIIISEPTKRLSVLSAIQEMKQIIKNIKKKDSESLIKLLKPLVQSDNYMENIQNLQTQHEYKEELNDKILEKNKMNEI
jgi:hypothetical protein